MPTHGHPAAGVHRACQAGTSTLPRKHVARSPGDRSLDQNATTGTSGTSILGAGDGVAADGTGIVVAYDYRTNQKAPLPAAVRAGVLALRGAAGR